ncbi:syntaxin-18 [Anopheles arabiensis]|uniref:Syntaxin-18 n=3 Tax=gambiae species complex TaxID=44542 RepID=Q7QHE8_ANOGA|nr:syntaxin-18 [Anopheles arabiensis]EAA05146.4 AGAP011160-PA [Anopheles gambiae str. PEST]
MDITSLFKASVKTVRLKLPPQSVAPLDKNRILQKKKPTPEVWGKAKTLKQQVTLLRNFLIENRAAYMQLAEHLKNSAPQMTNEERDLIDRETESTLADAGTLIAGLRHECAELKADRQVKEFLGLVVDSLFEYANGIRRIAQEQKQFRQRRQMETMHYIKLQPKMKTDPYTKPLEAVPSEREAVAAAAVVAPARTGDSLDSSRSADKTMTQTVEDMQDSSMYEEYESNDLSPEDIQMFESENIQLYNELKGLSEEVEQIQRNVADITQLQDIFTEKITLQNTDIDRIATNVIGTTENMNDANEQIKQAIQRNAGLRVWVLFFFIVMSFTLLFLDWYND